MNDGRSRQEQGPALGDVARDAMDHASMIVRDELKIARLEARRYVDHVKRDVAPRALFATAAAACALLAAITGAIALFLGILWVIGSIAWTFLIFAAMFTTFAAVLANLSRRPAMVASSVEIERGFPAVKMEEHRPEHALAAQERPEAHAMIVEAARREDREDRVKGEPPKATPRW